MLIAQISDTHILAKTSDDPMAFRRAENLRRCISDINRQGVDAVLHTGDSVHHGNDEEYAHLRDILSELEPPLFLAPGNRDRHAGLRNALGDVPFPEGGHLHYAIEDFPVRLIALDSVAPGERKGVFCAERRSFLDATLARDPEKPTILFIHHPPFDIADHYRGGYRDPEDAGNLAALVSRHGQVKRLFCGHVHCLHNERWGGTVAATMPSVAVDLRKYVDPAFGDTPLYVLHEVGADGAVVSRLQPVPA